MLDAAFRDRAATSDPKRRVDRRGRAERHLIEEYHDRIDPAV
jgi:hypothetical protein